MFEPSVLPSGWRLVDPPQRPVLFVNPWSGDGVAARLGLATRASDLGIAVVVLTPGDALEMRVRAAVEGGADALGMAGGDGSLAVVAAAAAEHDLPFVCVPAGTRNHFALDVGVDRHDVAGALEAFTAGAERHIDLAEVNGRVFVNNVSLGIYGEAVRRAVYRDAKVRTLLTTADEVLAPHGRAPAMRVVDDTGRVHDHLAILLVSNNPYSLDRPPAGTRQRLDSGRLGVIALDTPPSGSHPPGRAWSSPRLDVMAPAPVHAGVDGEALDLSSPLRFTIRPSALRVRISRQHPGASPSAIWHTARPRMRQRPRPTSHGPGLPDSPYLA